MHRQSVTEASNWCDGSPENGVTNLIFASNLPLCFLFGASLVPLFALEIRGSNEKLPSQGGFFIYFLCALCVFVGQRLSHEDAKCTKKITRRPQKIIYSRKFFIITSTNQ
jgi:hypothetical protein